MERSYGQQVGIRGCGEICQLLRVVTVFRGGCDMIEKYDCHRGGVKRCREV